MLVDIAARNAKAPGKPRKVADEKGMYLLVTQAGKYWRYDYRYLGKRKTLALGVYPETTLGEARHRRDQARKVLAEGDDVCADGSPVRTEEGRAAVMLWRFRVSNDGRLKGGWQLANRIERCGTHAGGASTPSLCLCLLAGSVLMCASASAAPLLRCVLESTGETKTHEAVVTNDPYVVRPVSINAHFRFKAVMMSDAQGSGIEYIKIYTYYTSTRGAVLLHQITYNHPLVSRKSGAQSLTGLQWVYSPRLERQFQFECHLLEKN